MNNEFKRMQKLAGLITENTNVSELLSPILAKLSLDKLEQMLQNHDWTYMFSDDRSNYSRGAKQEQEIEKLVAILGDEGQKMYDEYKRKNSPRKMEEGEGAYEYEKGKKAGEKIEKEKMSKSKLRKKIREMILAEMDGAAVEAEDYDPVAEAKKKDDEEDIDIEDINVEEPDTDMTDMGGGNDSEIEHIQDLLNQLQDSAEKLGDEKLLKQVGNTITFFTRQHVAEKPELNEVSLEALDRMDGLVSQSSVNMLIRGAQGIIKDLKEDGFDDEDIYDYIIERIKVLS